MEQKIKTKDIKCPKCGSHEVEVEWGMCLTSYPAQFRAHCKTCESSFLTSEVSNIIPQTQGFEAPKGWICPVCGRGVAPYVQVCPCVTGQQDFVWCNHGSINIS